jgi:integrase
MRIDLEYLNAIDAKGRRYWYYRRNGKNVRIAGEYGSPEFLECYRRIHEQHELGSNPASKARQGSLRALIESYKESEEYEDNEDKTRKDYLRQLDMLATNYGELPAATMPAAFIRKLRSKFRKKPRTANFIVQIISILMNHAIGLEWRQTNPASGIKPLKTGGGHRPWEEKEISKFRSQWPLGTVERTAFELALNTGQRGIDVVTMEHEHISDSGKISVMQQKTGKRIKIPVSNDLVEALAVWNKTKAAFIDARINRPRPLPIPEDTGVFLLIGELGNQLTADYFRHLMREAYIAAGLPVSDKKAQEQEAQEAEDDTDAGGRRGRRRRKKRDRLRMNAFVTTHGLRYTAATRLRELGLSPDVIGSITGQDTAEMIEKYSQQERNAEIAIDALNRATAAQRGGEVQNQD